jgi:2-C-methyl-D-erythritol 4-phosphate cytidylyltransferase
MRVCVILPAAGAGTRFGGDKLSQDLGGRPLLLRTVERFTKRDEVSSIIVAAPPGEEDLEAFQLRYGAALGFHGVVVVPGGRRERWETVRLALAAVPAECTHVAIHDAARPTPPEAMLDRVFAAAQHADAVIPGVAVSATLKRVGEPVARAVAEDAIADSILGEAPASAAGRLWPVVETVARAGLFGVQTPQVFRRELIIAAYDHVERSGGLDGVTDDAQVVERYGQPVMIVEGDVRNIKVTTPDDLALVRAIAAMDDGPRSSDARPAHKRC